MTSLDDHLRELFASGGPDAAELQGDVRDVRARLLARRRTVRRRAALVAVAAAIAGAVFLLASPHRDDDVIMPATTTRPDRSTTTATRPSTTDHAQTTFDRTSTSTTSSTSSTSETSAPPAPSIRDVVLGEATYTAACTGDDQQRTAALRGGSARLPIGPGSYYEVRLGPVGYADVDGDGDEDAVLVLHCDFVGADSDTSAQLRAYQTTADGAIEQIGTSLAIEHETAASADGARITVDVDKYGPTDPLCCPSSTAREVWRFDGRRFVLERSTPITTPGVSG
jgi:hypothetical protein